MDSNDEIKELKILWHLSFYDMPLSGIALYNGEKIYFKVTKECLDFCFRKPAIEINSDDEEYDDPVWDLLIDKENLYGFPNEIIKFVNDNIQQTNISERVGIYDIEIDGKTIWISQHSVVNLYRMPLDKLNEHEERHWMFQENVGYHTDYDPTIHKPYDVDNKEKTSAYFAKITADHEEKKANGLVDTGNYLDSYTLIRTVTGDQFLGWKHDQKEAD